MLFFVWLVLEMNESCGFFFLFLIIFVPVLLFSKSAVFRTLFCDFSFFVLAGKEKGVGWWWWVVFCHRRLCCCVCRRRSWSCSLSAVAVLGLYLCLFFGIVPSPERSSRR